MRTALDVRENENENENGQHGGQGLAMSCDAPVAGTVGSVTVAVILF
jgi:hypothetical protein